MKTFNITAQVYKNQDTTKQNLLVNQVVEGESSDQALTNFKIHFPSIQYSIVKILSVEEELQIT